jgi:hypothetical protein
MSMPPPGVPAKTTKLEDMANPKPAASTGPSEIIVTNALEPEMKIKKNYQRKEEKSGG